MKALIFTTSSHRRTGFTLLETSVVSVLVLILTGIGLKAYRSVTDKAAMVREVSAARHLIAAYTNYAAENNGSLLPGQKVTEGVQDRNGQELKSVTSKRWVVRLAPYFNYAYPGTVVVNEALKGYRSMAGHNPIQGLEADVYIASIAPSLGLNSTFVGGNYNALLDENFSFEPTVEAEGQYGRFFLSHSGQAVAPSRLIVFASARYRDANNNRSGNEHIFAPRLRGDLRWSPAFDPKANSAAFGHVDARWDARAVTAQLDGSVTLLNAAELQDMRRWSNQAAEADDPNWTLISHNQPTNQER